MTPQATSPQTDAQAPADTRRKLGRRLFAVLSGWGAAQSRETVCVVYRGASWVHYRRRRPFEPSKAPERMCGAPNNRSAQSSATLQGCFGQQRLQLTSLRLSGAASVRLSSTSPGSENGPVTRSQPSSRKSSSVMECETRGSLRANGRTRHAWL